MSDPLVAAVGNTVLDVLERDAAGRAGRASSATYLRDGLLRAARTGTRSSATSAAAACCRASSWSLDRETKEGADALGAAVTRRCLELGLHMNVVQLPGMGGVFRIAPPLTATREELGPGLAILDQAIGEFPIRT